jgi:ferredoxin--NADP+ reductase
VSRIVEDAEAGALNTPGRPDAAAIEPWLRGRVAGLVTWHGWQAIDRHERALAEPLGRPRIKLVRVAHMVGVAGADVERNVS